MAPARLLVLLGLLVSAGPLWAQGGWLGLGQNLLQNADVVKGAIENKDLLLGDVDEGTERRMGFTASAILLGAAPLVDDVDAQSYVNVVGRWLAMHTERPGLPWRFAILADDTINAFAAPGGFVYISRGLFLLLRNEHELAGVLAHEMGHVLERHHVEALINKERMNLAMELTKRASDQNNIIMDALVGTAKSVYSSGLDKADEFEADRIGVVVAERAGYDPYGLVHALMTLAAAKEETEMLAFFASTHPPIPDRLERLDTQLAKGEPGRIPSAWARLQEIQARLRAER